MARKIFLTVCMLLVCVANARAQDTDPLGGAFIPPDVVMSHQQDLNLSAAQRTAIQADVQNAQQHFTPLQWRLAAATEKLADIVKQSRVDQAKASRQLDAVLDLERQIKHTQITLMIAVKNELTPQQQATARSLGANPKR